LLAVRSKRVIVQIPRSRRNNRYSAVNWQKRDEISGVLARHATYGWRHLAMQKIKPRMHLDDLLLAGFPFLLLSFRV
jgi:hypothetical protein